jgi:hypothetical protein
MNSVIKMAAPAFFAVTTFMSAGTEAALTTYSSRASFEAQGTIAENYGFEDWALPPGGHAFPGDPYTAHGVTYNSGSNLILGPGYPGVGNSSHVLTTNCSGVCSLPFSVLSGYDMLGFDLGIYGDNPEQDSLVDFSITTNLSSYSFSNVFVPNVSDGMTFFGFIAEGGETISQMTLSNQPAFLPALDNVTLGNAALIPEPETYAMLMAGLGLLGLVARRRKRLPAA